LLFDEERTTEKLEEGVKVRDIILFFTTMLPDLENNFQIYAPT
jgi:hypothetical protein